MSPRSKILDINKIDQKLKRLAWQVYEKNSAEKEIIVVGISDRGLILAKQFNKKQTYLCFTYCIISSTEYYVLHRLLSITR